MNRQSNSAIVTTLTALSLVTLLLSAASPPVDGAASRTTALAIPGPWTTQIVDPISQYEYDMAFSIAADAEGWAHAAFIRSQYLNNISSTHLVYATNLGGVWHNRTVCQVESSYPEETAILAPPGGHVRIGLMNETGIFFFEDGSSTWTRTVLDGPPVAHMSMLLDSQGAIRLYYAKNSTAHEALKVGDAWQVREIFTAPSNWTDGSVSAPWGPVALDSMDRVHAAIGTSEGLVHVVNTGPGTWSTEMVDAGASPRDISIGIAGPPANATVIAYSDYEERNTKVASNHSWEVSWGSWDTTVVYAGSDGLSSALVTYRYPYNIPDTIQNLRLAFFGESPHLSLMIASADVNGLYFMGGAETIDEVSWSTGGTSMAADSSGNVHVLYYSQKDRSLKYATDAFAVPERPYGVSLYPGYHSVTIRWRWYENSGTTADHIAKSFRIYRTPAKSPTTGYLLATVHADYLPDYSGYSHVEYSFTDHGLMSNTSYTYSISAVNSIGEGIPSLGLSATPSGDLPPYYLPFLVSLSAAILFAAVVAVQNRKRIMAIKLPKFDRRAYRAPKTYPKKDPGEIDKEDVVDGYPKHLKRM